MPTCSIERNKRCWVVRGAVRNGLLCYVPTETALVSILSEALIPAGHGELKPHKLGYGAPILYIYIYI